MEFAQITDYAKTQRIVLLIDLNPLLHLQNPTIYLTSLLCSSKTLLSFPPFSSSSSPYLFAFKLFFSSLSPVLSSSKLQSLIPTCPVSLSFNHATSILHSLTVILSSFSFPNRRPLADGPDSSPILPPLASSLSASMRQILHDYGWDPVIREDSMVTGTVSENCDFLRSNLVVLFSPASKTVKRLSELLNVDMEDECLGSVDLFTKRFRGLFESVNNAFIARDFQLTWVDVENESGLDESELKSGYFESGVRSLQWGFCSTESIILGSALIPFGLIYPEIRVSSRFFEQIDSSRKTRAKLSLEMLDINEKPIKCKCCDLELVELKMLNRNIHSDVSCTSRFVDSQPGVCDQKRKLHVKALQSYRDCITYNGNLSSPLLVRESGKIGKGSPCKYFTDEVLDMLRIELDNSPQKKSIPIWQILLSFLYKESLCAIVHISSSNEDSYMGILKPFTVSSALLFLIDDNTLSNLVHDPGVAFNHLFCFIDSDSVPSSSVKCSQNKDVKMKKDKNTSHLLQNLTWSTFREAALEQSKVDLGEVFFARGCKSSKNLKFLKCWLKQIKKSSPCCLNLQKSHKIQKESGDTLLTESHQESEEPISTSGSTGEVSLTQTSRILDEAECRSETSETFFSNLSNKIQQGLGFEVVDLGALAERLVNSAIYWLSQKHDGQISLDSQTPVGKLEETDCCSVFAELSKLLLREPKDSVLKHKKNVPSFQVSNPGPTMLCPENSVREYELQILFRMEILRSEIGVSISEHMKQKFVKHICLLLETIQCHLDGGFFGDWSLDNYVGKIIKSRYCQTLEDVVQRIYTKMDLLLFEDENGLPDPFLNSEDSNHSWRENTVKDVMGENYTLNDLVSTEEKQQQPVQENHTTGLKKEEDCKKIEAQERRERAWRSSTSYLCRVPYLQRVWATKQPEAVKSKVNCHRKASKRKEIGKVGNDMVCETPMTENKRSNIKDSQTHNWNGNSCGYVSKALFKDQD